MTTTTNQYDQQAQAWSDKFRMNENTAQAVESIKNQLRSGEITLDQANVAMVRAERVRLITGPTPKNVRAALMAAVKAGQLGRVAKDGNKPEAFYHPSFEYLVAGERNAFAERELCRTVKALSSIMVHHKDSPASTVA